MHQGSQAASSCCRACVTSSLSLDWTTNPTSPEVSLVNTYTCQVQTVPKKSFNTFRPARPSLAGPGPGRPGSAARDGRSLGLLAFISCNNSNTGALQVGAHQLNDLGLVIHDEDLLCHYPPVSIKPTPLALGRRRTTDGIDHFQLHQPVCQEP